MLWQFLAASMQLWIWWVIMAYLHVFQLLIGWTMNHNVKSINFGLLEDISEMRFVNVIFFQPNKNHCDNGKILSQQYNTLWCDNFIVLAVISLPAQKLWTEYSVMLLLKGMVLSLFYDNSTNSYTVNHLNHLNIISVYNLNTVFRFCSPKMQH